MIGMSTASFYGKYSVSESFALMKEFNIKIAEVFLNTFSEYTSEYLAKIKEETAFNGLKVNSLHTLPTQFEPQLFSETKKQKQDALDFFEQVLKGAKTMGCPIYVMHGKPIYDKHQSLKGMNLDKLTVHLLQIVEMGKYYGVDVALENVHWAMCNNPEFGQYVKNKVRGLKFTLDVKQAYFSGYPFKDYIKVFGDSLVNVHVCDVLNGKTAMPGKGEMDFISLKKELDNIGYSGNIMVEVYSKDYDTLDELSESTEYLRGIFEV